MRGIALHVAGIMVLAALSARSAPVLAQKAEPVSGFVGEEPMGFPDESPPAPPPTVTPPPTPTPPVAAPVTPAVPAAPVAAEPAKKVILVPAPEAPAPAVVPVAPPVQTVVPVTPAPPVPLAAPAPKPEATPATAAAAAASLDEQARLAEEKKIIEGELANVGGLGLVPWENRIGVVLGLERLGEIFFIGIKPEINWSHEVWDRPFSMSFGIPFRLQLLDTRADRRWSKAGRPRAADWDQVSDWAQLIQFVKWGGKEKHFYLNVNQYESSSIGHGTIVKRYNQNLNFNTRRVSLQFDGFLDWFGGETYLNDIVGPNVMGALVFAKPLSFIDRSNYMLRSFSLGFTIAADVDAPLRNKLDFDDADDDGRRATEIAINQSNFEPKYASTVVLAYGIDVEEKWIDTGVVDWKSYVDYSWLETGVATDNGPSQAYSGVPTRAVRSGGFTLGQLVRVNLGDDPKHALRFRAEYRTYDFNYLPSYFDVLYEAQRVQYYTSGGRSTRDIANMTKVQQVLGRDPDGPRVHGVYLEGSWRMSHYLAVAMGFEMNNQTADDSLFVHVEVPMLDWWQFMATYHRRTASGFGDLFKWFSGENDLFLAKTRFAMGDLFAVTLEALTPFGIGPESFFRSTVQVNLNVEIGFSY